MKDNKEELEKKDKDYMRAKVFFEKNIPVHIKLKNGSFYNGKILEEPTQDFFFIFDGYSGKQLIFFIELSKPMIEFNNKGVENG